VVDAGAGWAAGPQWYAVQTKPRGEERARYWLGQRVPAVTVFLPKVAYPRRRGVGRAMVVEPLFPSYLFVRMELDPRQWSAVRWTPGVKRIVTTGETPTPVPAEAMRLLLERYGEGDVLRWRPTWRGGETVYVVAGPFAGLVGILERPCGRRDRVRVLLKLLGAATPVELDVADVEVVA
jgi:transcriptional antiterminator RfaH